MTTRRSSKPKWGKLPPGVRVVWLPANRAWAVGWHEEVLRVFPAGQEHEVREYLEYIRPHSPPLALQAESAAAKGEKALRTRRERQHAFVAVNVGGTIRGNKRSMDLIQTQVARSLYRDTVRKTRETEKAAQAVARKELKGASGECKLERKQANAKVSQVCKSRRDKIRGKAHAVRDKGKSLRDEKRSTWLWYGGHVTSLIPPGGRKHSRSESDDMALHSLEPEFHDLWKKHHREITYDLQPDMRAERFMEWVRENPDRMEEMQYQRLEAGEKEIVKAERKHFEDRYGEGSWSRAERGEPGPWGEGQATGTEDEIPF